MIIIIIIVQRVKCSAVGAEGRPELPEKDDILIALSRINFNCLKMQVIPFSLTHSLLSPTYFLGPPHLLYGPFRLQIPRPFVIVWLCESALHISLGRSSYSLEYGPSHLQFFWNIIIVKAYK